MKKTALHKLVLNRESIRALTRAQASAAHGGGTLQSVCVGCTTENTWYCPTASGCTNCPICNN